MINSHYRKRDEIFVYKIVKVNEEYRTVDVFHREDKRIESRCRK